MKPLLLALSLVLPLATSLSLQEDDLVFDDVGEPSAAAPAMYETPDEYRDRDVKHPRSRDKKQHDDVERLWGIPDTSVIVGHVFKMRILEQAFSGSVDHFEIHGTSGQPLPRWLQWDDAASTLLGVPAKRDTGNHRVTVKAFGRHGNAAKDVFTINVIAEKRNEVTHKDGKTHCDEGEDQTLLTVVLDARFENLKPAERVNALENLAGFLGLHVSAFSMHPYVNKETSTPDTSVILSGSGNVKRRREKHSTAVQWQVGCDGRLWRHQTDLVKQLREQAKDGTLAEVLQQSVLLWRVKTDASSLLRNRRDAGSGDYDADEDYDNYDDYEYNENYEEDPEDGEDEGPITEQPLSRANFDDFDRPHRHHHGEKTIDSTQEVVDEDEIIPMRPQIVAAPLPLNTTSTTSTTTTTPMTTTLPSTTLPPTTATEASTTMKTTTTTTATTTTTTATTTTTTTPKPVETEPPKERTENVSVEPVTMVPASTDMSTQGSSSTMLQPNVTNVYTVAATTPKPVPNTTVKTTTMIVEEVTEQPTTLPPPPPPVPTLPNTTTTPAPTTPQPVPMLPNTTTSSPPSTPPLPIETEETVEIGQKNFPPVQEKALIKLAVTAGKPLRYVIPADTFSDLEDGTTRELDLDLYRLNSKVNSTHWLQFDKRNQIVYGLPLDNVVSTWYYDIIATDSEGLNASAKLDVHVQQHPQSRAVNHEFTIYLRIDRLRETPNVDWELKVLKGLVKLYGDADEQLITVQNFVVNGNQALFTWSNDTVPRSAECPKEYLEKLLDVLVANRKEEPSVALQNVLASDGIKVNRVVYQGVGQCKEIKRPALPSPVTQGTIRNEPPQPRNQIDQINATVGQLLVFTVPMDTFYDTEDGSTRNMKLTLMTKNQEPIPSDEWLQFDTKNQQFYGVPMEKDIGRTEYHLVAKDSKGSPSIDGLVVVVRPSNTPHEQNSVNFSMTLEIPYESFANSASQKRKFVEKLQELFGDDDTSAISLDSVSENTVVTWHNRTLVRSYCPHNEITRLRDVLVKDERMLTERVEEILSAEFPVKQVTLTPTKTCRGQVTSVHSPTAMPPPNDDQSAGVSNDSKLITIIVPAIIIAAMILLAGIIACILYRRKRSGKMSVSEQDDERQSFRNKGIPVIFQDELDEKPDPGNKSPVILKEEKPPLPPPEYQKTEDGADVPMLQNENSEEPYQPPPPFATNRDSNRQNRPKPTPTYRKPPPYVPP